MGQLEQLSRLTSQGSHFPKYIWVYWFSITKSIDCDFFLKYKEPLKRMEKIFSPTELFGDQPPKLLSYTCYGHKLINLASKIYPKDEECTFNIIT